MWHETREHNFLITHYHAMAGEYSVTGKAVIPVVRECHNVG